MTALVCPSFAVYMIMLASCLTNGGMGTPTIGFKDSFGLSHAFRSNKPATHRAILGVVAVKEMFTPKVYTYVKHSCLFSLFKSVLNLSQHSGGFNV